MSLSLCMIVKNEQENLPRCLDSVKDIVDEMIIVDTGSTDTTVEIANSYGAKIFYFPWNNSFSDARNYSLKFASCDWILLMDADDELEKADKQKVLELVKEDTADAYFFETVSYLGDAPGLEMMNNLNPRLIKNRKGYFFSNSIHEQIWSNILTVNPSAKILVKDIKVYHYGYLNKNIAAQNKRARNINLLMNELNNSPNYGFTLFNLGNEFFAMSENLKALEFYEKSYQCFDTCQGYSSKLVFKLANCYVTLGRYEDALRIISEGMACYPLFTDLEYIRAFIYYSIGNPTLAVKHLEKCIEMGESPSSLNIVIGAGTYRSYLMLGEIYHKLEDYDSAEMNLKKALECSQAYTPALLKLVEVLCSRKTDSGPLKTQLEELRSFEAFDFDSHIYKLLIQYRQYSIAAAYIHKHEKISGVSPDSRYHKGLCKFFTGNFKSAYILMKAVKDDPEYLVKAICTQSLCRIMEKRYSDAASLLAISASDSQNIIIKTYQALNNVLDTGSAHVLCEDAKLSEAFTGVIFDLLTTLMKLRELDIFEKALGLLNLVNDKTVLLKLAKLYYREKCYNLSYNELMRSIKLFDCIDAEGSEMLYKLKLKGF